VVISIILGYLALGLIIFFLQDYVVRKYKSELYDGMGESHFLLYMFFSIVFWLPNIIEYFCQDKNDENDFEI